jgi:hypothetical protein
MKKKVFLFLFLIIAFGAPLIAEPLALVVKVTGVSHVIRAGKNRTLMINDLIQKGDTIHTKKNGYANLQFSSGIICQIGSDKSDTEMTVESIERGSAKSSIRLRMKRGSILTSAEMVSKNDEYLIMTPTAIAGVRGTEFIVDASEQSTSVLVNEGAVAVQDPTGQIRESIATAGSKIIADHQAFRQSLIEQFEKARFEMVKALEDTKQKNFEMLIEQKRKDRERLEKAKNPF